MPKNIYPGVRCRELIINSLCLHLTPVSISGNRYCSHSNIIFCASIQCNQNSRGWRRWACDDGLTAPRCCTCSVLCMVLRDGQVTLRSNPGHSQSWSLMSDYLGQRHISHLGRGFSIESLQIINTSKQNISLAMHHEMHDAWPRMCNYEHSNAQSATKWIT